MVENNNQWSEYIGRSRESRIMITLDQIRGLAALLDYPVPPWPEGVAPPTAHWLNLFPPTQQSELGPDGHERLGEFLPPLKHPRRMWAGGRMQFMQALPVDEPITHRQCIIRIEDKAGRSGAMTLVTVRHEYLVNDEVRIEDEQDIIYRDVPSAKEQKPDKSPDDTSAASESYDWSRQVLPDPVLLFRYSAISFNSHRIHYDREYAIKEGYPGLLVHGPLTATLLVDLYQRNNNEKSISRFDYTARRPLYDGETFSIMGRNVDDGRVWLQAVSSEGSCAMTAELHTS